MATKRFEVVILNKENEIVRTSKSWSCLTEKKADSKRNSLQAYWDKFYPDFGYHAQVRPMKQKENYYRVYNGTGLLMGEYPYDMAKELVDSHDDWTWVKCE